MGDQDIDILGRVNDLALAVDEVDGLDTVATSIDFSGAFELHAPQTRTRAQDEVVGLAVTPGLGHVETEGFRLQQKGGFRELTRALRVATDRLSVG